MKKIISVTTILILASFLILFNGCNKKSEGPSDPNGVSLFKMIPEDASGLFILNFRKLSSLSVFDKFKEEFEKKSFPQNEKIFENYEDFVKQTGIDPKKDLYSLAFAVYGDMNKKSPEMSMIFSMKYDKAKILSLLKEKVQSMSEINYLNSKLYKFKDDKGKDMLLYLADNFISAGTEKGLKKVVDLMNGKTGSINSNKRMMGFLNKVNGNPVASFVFAIPKEARGVKGSGMFQADLSKAEAVYGAIDFSGTQWNGNLIMVSPNEEGNKKLKTTLDGLKGFGAMAGPEFAELVNNINISASPEDLTISFKVSTELLDKLKKKAEQKMSNMKKGGAPVFNN